jgi:hypothetical protein
MILRRLSKHVEDQNWFAVALDFLIVVTGVFIGLQVANWNEARAERIRETRYLERLDAEMDIINQRVESGVEIFSDSVRGLDLLLDTIRLHRDSPEAPLPDDEILAGAILNSTAGRVPAGSPTAFKEMMSSGTLGTLRDDELRQALFAYDEFSVIARDGWRTIREQHHDAANLVLGLMDIGAPEHLDRASLGRSPPVFGFDRERYLNNPEIHRAFNILLAMQINQAVLAQEQLRLSKEIERLIEEARNT